MRLTKAFSNFFESERSGGIVLICATVLSLIFANGSFREEYAMFWTQEIAGDTVINWINDGLMTLFFLMIGLELEREIYAGELSDIKKAAMPIFAALGGMLFPAVIYLAFNAGGTTHSGWGIPMATDIAFAIGILSLLGNRIPSSLKVFLTALAVIDDLGAILVIAFFYTDHISWENLAISLVIFAMLGVFNRMKVRNLIPYIIGGIGMWYFMHHSGIHATITGVLLAFAMPFGNGDEKSTSYIAQHGLHIPVAFLILPLFAFANTDITLGNHWLDGLTSTLGIGIIAGLVIGKPLGIFAFSWVSAKLGWCRLPLGIRWKHIFGVGLLGGIGFTMSIFISLLAFQEKSMIETAKIATLVGSVISGLAGFGALSLMISKKGKRRSRKA